MDCDNAYWFRGYPIPRGANYAPSPYGHYLPGDEPGYMCRLTESYCREDSCPAEKKEDRDVLREHVIR